MQTLNIANIKNILIFGDAAYFDKELLALKKEGLFDVTMVDNRHAFQTHLENTMNHLIIFDGLIGYDNISVLLKDVDSKGITNVPMILVVDEENFDERFEYFNIGITNFYERNQVDYLVDLIRRIDREETYHKSFKEMSIAILDDDRFHLRILNDILERHGIYNVDTFDHPQDLLDAKKVYDIYLIDLILPDVDGEIVMYEIRKRHEYAVIMGISSIEKHSTIAKVLAIGANDYLVKPINASVFMAKLYNYGKSLILRKENESKTKVLQELASKDGLTSLYNHRTIQELLNKQVKFAKRHKKDLSVMMLDIDNFKKLNDQYGHQFGDEVLSNIADVLLDTVREHDIVGRYGGEEFIVVFPNTNDAQGLIIGDRIKRKIESLTFRIDVNVTVSGGIASLTSSLEQLVYDADCLMYHAKSIGKNKIIIKKNTELEIEKYETC